MPDRIERSGRAQQSLTRRASEGYALRGGNGADRLPHPPDARGKKVRIHGACRGVSFQKTQLEPLERTRCPERRAQRGARGGPFLRSDFI